ncbi:hypothetical protein CASFOL_010397 [Castilleja foliolosa]|uniref:Pectinesterase n=1 Tax=Castilleja foliolosa TaxID=1961234 RepID=A0ABD3DUC1_9LAMI
MELKFLILALISHFFLISHAHSKISPSSDINRWCNRTPYPEPCKHFMTNNTNHKFTLHKHKRDFRKAAIQLALDHTIRATKKTKTLGPKCRSGCEKAAWTDCVKLYEDTIEKLNKSLGHNTKCNDFDIQTWLSAALTNLDTCRTGFIELGVPDFVLPMIMSNSVSKLICNTLALGEYNGTTPVPHHETYSDHKDGFPTWVTTGDRRLLQMAGTMQPNLVVAQDGSGTHRTIAAALDEAGRRSGNERFVIHVKRGVYKENLEIGDNLNNIMLVGDGMKHTIITGSRSFSGGYTTFQSATVAVIGERFIAQGITFRNTAGPQKYQAVALRSSSDFSVFYRCGFEGYQDTLYVHCQRQFFKECYIFGTVDIIFGNAAVVFQNCMIYGRRPIHGQQVVITAQSRTDPNQNTGISIHNSRVMAGSDLAPVVGSVQTYLGRPWKEYSRTVFLKSYLDSLVDRAGWLEWDGDFALDTLYYGEYRNMGPGSDTSRRVRWKGYHVITSSEEAKRFTLSDFIGGPSWLSSTGVPFTAGL